jgi:predicted dehydrogenase
MKPRLAFVGLGWIGRHRLEALVRGGVAEASVLYDPAAAAVEAARGIVQAPVVDDFDAIFNHAIDGVVVATPNALHAPQSVAALEHGLPVFCQKPLARDGHEARRVVQAARDADRHLGVDLCYRRTAAVRALRHHLLAGDIGRPYMLDLVFHNAYGPDKDWFYDRASSGGGCVLDLGTHLVDLALWLLDYPRVEAVDSRLWAGGRLLRGGERPLPVEDHAVARLDLEGGTVAHIACSWRAAMGCDAVIGVTIHGERGALRMRNVNGSFYDFAAERLVGTRTEPLVGPPDAWGGRAAADWATSLLQGRHYRPEADQYATVHAVLDQVLHP